MVLLARVSFWLPLRCDPMAKTIATQRRSRISRTTELAKRSAPGEQLEHAQVGVQTAGGAERQDADVGRAGLEHHGLLDAQPLGRTRAKIIAKCAKMVRPGAAAARIARANKKGRTPSRTPGLD